jgi:hypothetical protein
MPGLELGGDAKLQGFILGLFRWCFQDWHDQSPLFIGEMHYGSQLKLHVRIQGRGQTLHAKRVMRAGVTPRRVSGRSCPKSLGSLPPEVEVLAAFRFVLQMDASDLFFRGFLLLSDENWTERWTESAARRVLHLVRGFTISSSVGFGFK